MKLTMDKILKKYKDCNKFSLSDRHTNCKVNEIEFDNALTKLEEEFKESRRKYYNKENFLNYPQYDELFEEIKNECILYDKNKREDRYCSSICDLVGKTTKYGKENKGFFWPFYHEMGLNIDRQKKKNIYCKKNKINPLDKVPKEIKDYLLYYEVSFSNEVTVSESLFINYYFELNETTKKYLLNFEDDFSFIDIEDLALYKDNELKFSSCTHERFNSHESIISILKNKFKLK